MNIKSEISKLEHKIRHGARSRKTPNNHLVREIGKLERRLKADSSDFDWRDTELWKKKAEIHYRLIGKAAEKLGSDVLLALMTSSIFDLEQTDSGTKFVLLTATEGEAEDFNRDYQQAITEILRAMTGDQSSVTFLELPEEK